MQHAIQLLGLKFNVLVKPLIETLFCFPPNIEKQKKIVAKLLII